MPRKKKKDTETSTESEAPLDREAAIDALSKDLKHRLDGMKACLDDGGRPTISEYNDMLKDLKTLRRRILGSDGT
ncbi:MAG TPA: hypothetical protein VHE30_06490 [Polyangiaceae bacterium]|nr:hypothetical protein [Polyangiaceae bacterium]